MRVRGSDYCRSEVSEETGVLYSSDIIVPMHAIIMLVCCVIESDRKTPLTPVSQG